MTVEKRELRDLIRSRIEDGATPDQIADRLAEMFFHVEDEWREYDVTGLGQLPGSQIHNERWLVARVHRETRRTSAPLPDRTAGMGA
jgi:hypothetical protein